MKTGQRFKTPFTMLPVALNKTKMPSLYPSVAATQLSQLATNYHTKPHISYTLSDAAATHRLPPPPASFSSPDPQRLYHRAFTLRLTMDIINKHWTAQYFNLRLLALKLGSFAEVCDNRKSNHRFHKLRLLAKGLWLIPYSKLAHGAITFSIRSWTFFSQSLKGKNIPRSK